MLAALIQFSVRNRYLVVLVAALFAALGGYNFTRLPIDAVPDITNVQVQINTPVEGLTPVEIEKRITFPIETAMSGLPQLEQIRSLSRYGLSQVTVVFQDGTDIYWARQLVGERLVQATESFPEGFAKPAMGPISTGLGEIFMWVVRAEPNATKEDGSAYDLTDLRTIQDWIIRPQLLTVPGVTEVNSIGGFERQFHVTPYPDKLIAHAITLQEVFETLEKNNTFAGGGYIEHAGEQYLIQASGTISNIEELRSIALKTEDGVPVYLKDIAAIAMGKELRTGAATFNGEESVIGTAMMLMGANSRTVSTALAARMQDVQKTLPAGVIAEVVYNRTKLVDATIYTVEKNLLEGALLVIAVLFLILGSFRVSIFVALAIPLSMLFAVSGMLLLGISGNLLSLGAIDFGIIVDGSVVMAENIIRRFAERQHRLGRVLNRAERFDEAFEASREVAGPTLAGVGIIMIVYLPILTLTGIEGKMFVPMAKVVLLALFGALIVSFTLVPALIAIFLTGKVSEEEGAIVSAIKRVYGALLPRAIRNKAIVVSIVVAVLAASGLLASRLGSEFVPQLDEKDIAVQALRIPSTSLTQSLAMQAKVEKALMQFPEVALQFARVGTAEVATDPMPPSIADGYVILKPIEEWPKPRRTKAELLKAMEAELRKLPGNLYEISQPIELRFNELISGVRSDVAVKIFGDDLEVLRAKGQEVLKVISGIKGASGPKLEQVTGLPSLRIDIKRDALARYGLNVEDVHTIISMAIGGKSAGQLFEGDRRFDIVVRLPEDLRQDISAIRNLPISVAHIGFDEDENRTGHRQSFDPRIIPLREVADINIVEGPNQISREDGKRRIVVQTNIEGRDLGSFVKEATKAIDEQVKLPSGYWLTWGGQFQNLQAAKTRLEIVVPVAMLLILFVLISTFGSMRDSVIVFSGVPFALTGGVLALWLRGIPFSISAGIGFIALSGVAVLNGVVMISFIRKLVDEGRSVGEAVIEGSLTRLRPVLMTALVASLGFIPMAISHGTGAEVQRPLATVVIGGIISSTLLTLLVLPVLYMMFPSRKPEAE